MENCTSLFLQPVCLLGSEQGFFVWGAGRFVRWSSSTPLSKHFSEPKWLNSGEEVIRNQIKLATKQPLKSKINLVAAILYTRGHGKLILSWWNYDKIEWKLKKWKITQREFAEKKRFEKNISKRSKFFVKSRFARNFHSKLQENETTLKLKFKANYWAHQLE